MGGSKSISGFMLPNYSHKFKEYLPKLIKLVSEGKIKILVDLGKNDPQGAFEGIESVVRAEEFLHRGANLGKVVVKIN